MESMSARAFLVFQLREAGRSDLLALIRNYERSGALPAGRYLTGIEICRYLEQIGKKKPSNRVPLVNPDETQVEMMDSLWRKYRATQLETGRAFEETHPDLRALTMVEEIHAWEDWACEQLGVKVA